MIHEQARQAGLAYVDAINARNLDKLLDLFAEQVQLNHPFGLFQGRQKLAEFYGFVMQADTRLSVHRVVAEGHVAVIEVSAVSPQAPDQAQYALDLFQVDDAGKIVDLSIYYRNFDLKSS